MKKINTLALVTIIFLFNSLSMYGMMTRLKNWYNSSVVRPRRVVKQERRGYGQPIDNNTEVTSENLDNSKQRSFFSNAWNWLSGSSQPIVQKSDYVKVEPVVWRPEIPVVNVANKSSYFPTPEIDKKTKEFFGEFAMVVPKNNAQAEEAYNKIIINFSRNSFLPNLAEKIKYVKDYINYMNKEDAKDRTSQIYSHGFRINKFEAPLSAAHEILNKLLEFKKQSAKAVVFNIPSIKDMDQKDVSMKLFMGLNTSPFLYQFTQGNYLKDTESWFDAQQESDLLAALSQKVTSIFDEINSQCNTYEKQFIVLSSNEDVNFSTREEIRNSVKWLKNTEDTIGPLYMRPLNWYANSLWSASSKAGSDDVKIQLHDEISKIISVVSKTHQRVLQLLKQYENLYSEKSFSIIIGEEDDKNSEWREGETYEEAIGRKYGKKAQEIIRQERLHDMRDKPQSE